MKQVEIQSELLNTSSSVKTTPITAEQPASQPVDSQSVAYVQQPSMTVFSRANYSNQLRVGLVVGHTISTAIDWQGARREGQQDSDGPANPGEKVAPLH